MTGASRTDDHEAERLDVEPIEELAQGERGLGCQPVRPADEQHAVDPLREHLAVDEAQERRAVEQDVVVLGLLDLVEEGVECVAGEQLGRIGRHPAAREDVQASRARRARR